MSLYFTILIISVLTGTLLILITIGISQTEVVWTLGDSVTAFYAADSGTEEALYRTFQQGNFQNFSGTINSASYDVAITTTTGEVIIESIGSYKGTKRGIETRY